MTEIISQSSCLSFSTSSAVTSASEDALERSAAIMNDDDTPDPYSIEDENGPDLNSQSFRLNIYGASGGTIIETTKYDRKSDENRHSLHIVTEDKDLGQELAKIITMEQLR